jgi:DNA-binding MarR family transcriptional regulator
MANRNSNGPPSSIKAYDRKHPWAQVVLSADTIAPYRVPFPLSRQFHQICATVLAETLAGEDVAAPLRYGALCCVCDFPGISQTRLAELLGADRTNVSQIVDELETKGLIRRLADPDDRRAHKLRSTQRGTSLRERLISPVTAAQARILAPLASHERQLLVDLLARVVEANEEYARPGAGRRPPRKMHRPEKRSRGAKASAAQSGRVPAAMDRAKAANPEE